MSPRIERCVGSALCGAAVFVMESADPGNGIDFASVARRYRPRIGRVAIQRQVRAAVVIIAQVILNDPFQVLFGQHDYVVQTLATDRADESLDIGIFPG